MKIVLAILCFLVSYALAQEEDLNKYVPYGKQLALEAYLAQGGPMKNTGKGFLFTQGPMKGKTYDQTVQNFLVVWSRVPDEVIRKWALQAKAEGNGEWRKYVQNENFQANERAKRERQEDIEEEEERQVANEGVASGGGATYTRDGNRLIPSGANSPNGGYLIDGDTLTDAHGSSITHRRSGAVWVPVDGSHPQINITGK
jgi:hypothetical protein